MVLQQLDTHIQKKEKKKKNLDPFLRTYTKLTLKWTIDLHGRVKTIIFLEENVSENLSDLGEAKFFFIGTQKAQTIKQKINTGPQN